MNLLDFGFCFLPIVAEFDFSTHATLIAGETLLALLKTIERLDVSTVTHRRESYNTDIDTDR